MLMQKKKIAVLGAGVMGTGIAQTFAAKGHEVMLIYVYDDKLRSKPLETMKGNLDILCQNDVMTEEEIPEILGRVRFTESLEEAAMVHGMDADELLAKINEYLALKED